MGCLKCVQSGDRGGGRVIRGGGVEGKRCIRMCLGVCGKVSCGS